MRRTRKSKQEILEGRRRIQERAAAGLLAFPGAIREIRNALDLTQEEFARAFKLTRRQVVELETGTANPTLETLTKVLRPFRLTVGPVPLDRAPQETEGSTPLA